MKSYVSRDGLTLVYIKKAGSNDDTEDEAMKYGVYELFPIGKNSKNVSKLHKFDEDSEEEEDTEVYP